MPYSANRAANKAVTMPSPALAMQYSPRVSETGVGADRAHINDRRIGEDSGLHLGDHLPGDTLREEEWRLEVNRQHFIVTLLGHIQQTGANSRRHPGIVHQQIDAAKAFQKNIHHRFPRRCTGDVRRQEQAICAQIGHLGEGLIGSACPERKLIPTCQPAWASARAIPLPMPREAPVIKAA